MNYVLGLCVGLYFSVSLYIASFVNNADGPEGNFDEKCHFPLATLFCNGSYNEWNPKVTTPPGLYIFTVAPLKLLRWPCTIYNLRIFNIFFNSFSFIILYHIISYYHSGISQSKKYLTTINLSLFPLNYFFSFLYYTDPLSTLVHLLMHFLWIKKRFYWSAVAGFIGLLARQTAIVWVFFHALLTIEKILRTQNNNSYACSSFEVDGKTANGKTENGKTANGKTANGKTVNGKTVNGKTANGKSNKYDGFEFKIRVKYLLKEIVQNSFGYAVVGLLFVIFVYVNGGIVLGDKTNHEITLNLPQFLYFTLFTGILALPHLISQMSQLTLFIRSHKALTALVAVTSALIVRYNTVAHYYNLTDYHHLTHYFITAVSLHPYFALSLVPFYTICTVFFLYNSIRSLGKTITTIFLFVIAMNLVFQLLFEMRYFIIAFMLFRLRIQTRKWSVLLAEFSIFLALNIATISLYVMRPTIFPDDKRNFQILMY